MLADELIDGVEGRVDPEWAQQWTPELRRRSAAADEREARGEPRGAAWSDVKKRLLDALAER